MSSHCVTENHFFADGLDIQKLLSSPITYTFDETPPKPIYFLWWHTADTSGLLLRLCTVAWTWPFQIWFETCYWVTDAAIIICFIFTNQAQPTSFWWFRYSRNQFHFVNLMLLDTSFPVLLYDQKTIFITLLTISNVLHANVLRDTTYVKKCSVSVRPFLAF